MRFTPTVLSLAALLCTSMASAQTAPATHTSTAYIQAGSGDDSSYALVVGATMPWKNWSWNLGNGTVRGHWDGWVGGWSGEDLRKDRFTAAVIGIGPSLRWRGDQGNSPWFVEAGTGLTFASKHFYSSNQRMGTRWNFASHIGVGMNFGAAQQHELSLRLQHASNAGAKQPNPGINFVLLRYAHAF